MGCVDAVSKRLRSDQVVEMEQVHALVRLEDMTMRNRQVVKKPTPHPAIRARRCFDQACNRTRAQSTARSRHGVRHLGQLQPVHEIVQQVNYVHPQGCSKAQHGGKVCPVLVKSAGCNEGVPG